MERSGPITVQLYCRLEVVVHDPEAVTTFAVQRLRAADIDWSGEDDDLESAVAELGADFAEAFASVADPERMVDGVPGVEVRRARYWSEIGAAHPCFQPGFEDAG